MLKYEKLINQMSLEEKVAMTSGKDYWRTKPLSRLGIHKITLSDGPHGLRHQGEEQDHMGINESNPSTCFPLACLTAASFDPSLLHLMGRAIGYEALAENVQVVLGPGVNLKRNPLCGRNFEYFSEDPVLTGELATEFIKGVKSMGVGVSLKHFALNNQEKERMVSDSLVDLKTMFDLYLKAFEKPIKEGKPDTVMCSYNLVNGTYASENPWLLTQVLREDFGFDGVVVTDWGAMNDKVKSLKAGLDLEMPGSEGYFDAMTLKALQAGTLKEETLNKSVDRILDLVAKTLRSRKQMIKTHGDFIMTKEKVADHHQLARKIATESAVLMQNSMGLLPLSLKENKQVHLVGELARTPRYQGAGSSHINPYQVTSLKEIMEKNQVNFNFIKGYSLTEGEDYSMENEGLQKIKKEDVVILTLGLPESYEAEGFDRKHMSLPEAQNSLVEKILEKTSNVIVLLYGGAPVEMPWASKVASILNLYLPGQAGGEAAFDLVYGITNPSGKLPETYPLKYEDHITSHIYGKQTRQVEYREGLYVGYRYFDRRDKEVLFPFGHGLSYTEFKLSDLAIETKVLDFGEKESYQVSFVLENLGGRAGKEVAQLYLQRKNLKGYGVKKRLLAFKKVALLPHEKKVITFALTKDDFLEYDAKKEKKIVVDGEVELYLGSSSKNLPLKVDVTIKGETLSSLDLAAFYHTLEGKPTREDFITLLGRPIVEVRQKRSYSLQSTLSDMKEESQMKPILLLLAKILKSATKTETSGKEGFQTVYAMLMETPIKRLSLLSPEQMPKYLGKTLVHVGNKSYGKAVKQILFQRKEK